MLITKNWVYRLIQGPDVHISLQFGQKSKLVKYSAYYNILKVYKLFINRNTISRCNTLIQTAILLFYCNITLSYITDCNILHCNIKLQYTVIFL